MEDQNGQRLLSVLSEYILPAYLRLSLTLSYFITVSCRNLMLVKGLLFTEMQVNYAWWDATDYCYVERFILYPFVNSLWHSLLV